ncbi:MAG TPA: hypothetical protein VE735_05560 [Gammaproteobacteria bacterium]|nr:hypothetical protein [Gammaproteobacteria bacterium]
MWRIIQAQQKEIEALKAKLQRVEIQPGETPQETAQEQQQVQELERKTADYRNFETEVGEGRADEFNLGLGFIF